MNIQPLCGVCLHVSISIPEMNEDAYQLFDIKNETGTPERRLLLAIIERAILDYVGNEAKEKEEAGFWLFLDSSDSEDQFSFEWTCSQLDLQSKAIRDKIKKMPMRGDSRLAPWYMTKNLEKEQFQKAS